MVVSIETHRELLPLTGQRTPPKRKQSLGTQTLAYELQATDLVFASTLLMAT